MIEEWANFLECDILKIHRKIRTSWRLFFFTAELPKPNLTNLSGRKESSYNDVGGRSKRQKVNSLIDLNTPEKVIDAGIKLLTEKNSDTKKIFGAIESRDKPFRQILDESDRFTTIKANSTIESLKILIKLDLSVQQYKLLRKNSKKNGFAMYQPYFKIMLEK